MKIKVRRTTAMGQELVDTYEGNQVSEWSWNPDTGFLSILDTTLTVIAVYAPRNWDTVWKDD